MTDIMLNAALQYAAIGWPIFPCAAGGKDPAIIGGNGFKDATTDEAIIRGWWAKHPNSNIGFYPHGAGLSVIDVDVKNGGDGYTQLEALEAKHGQLPHTQRQDTPSGGGHLFFLTDKPMPNNKIAPDIDIRCANGYVLLAPSIADDRAYEWIDGWSPDVAVPDLDFAEMPQWVVDLQQERIQTGAQSSKDKSTLTYIVPDENAQAAIAERLAVFLMKCPKVDKRFNGNTDGLKDTSGSSMDMSMCVFLKIAGFDYSETRFILETWPHGSSDPQRSNGNRYWERLWQRSADPEKDTAQMFESMSEPDFWIDPVDLFADAPVPEFPLRCVPAAICDYAAALSAQSGFDSGGYAFAGLIAASGLINHSLKLEVTSAWTSSAVLWGGLSAESGGGKDPVMSPMVAPVKSINDRLMADSTADLRRWEKAKKEAQKENETTPPKPAWQQRLIHDVTTEEVGKLLSENDGLLLQMSEITEFIGRMDAYSGGGNAGSKDRGAWLRARDGGSHTINRASWSQPLVVSNFSVGILAGMQPEKLAELMGKRGGGSADGLFQRFLMFLMRPAKQADLMADVPVQLAENYSALFDVIQQWNEKNYAMFPPALTQDGVRLFNDYMNDARTIAQCTTQGRFAEHLNKFPAFTLNICLTLHTLECAAKQVQKNQQALVDDLDGGSLSFTPPVNCWSNTVSTETLRRAIDIMRVLYRHSEAAYSYLDDARPEIRNLAVAAGDAVLTKSWNVVNMGDLTRHATGWQAADQGFKQEALNLLIELGWLIDVTPAPEQGRRGRPSEGRFAVNPKVHSDFSAHAAAVVETRKRRFDAIQRAAMARTA